MRNRRNELYRFNSAISIFYAESYLLRMKSNFDQCKLIMKVTDEELEVFSKEHRKLLEATKESGENEQNILIEDLKYRNELLRQARQNGKKALK